MGGAVKRKMWDRWLNSFARKPFFVFALIIVPLGPIAVTEPSSPIKNQSFISISDTVLMVDEEIIFQFDIPQESEKVRVSVSPREKFTISWSDDERELSIKPVTTWQAETDYTVGIGSFANAPSVLHHFTTQKYPEVIAVTSEHLDDGSAEITPGTEVVLHFDSLAPNTTLQTILRPNIAHEVSIDEAENKAVLTFNASVPEIAEMEILTYARMGELATEGIEGFHAINRFVFDAFPEKKSEWPEDQSERVDVAAANIEPQVSKGKYIDVNLTSRITTLFEDGEIVTQFINSPGAPETPTPTGRFKVENKAENPRSESFGVYLPYWLAFTADGKYGLHGLIEWPVGHPEKPEGGKESTASIDNAVSPGCVRHTDELSSKLYAWADVGTPVVIYE